VFIEYSQTDSRFVIILHAQTVMDKSYVLVGENSSSSQAKDELSEIIMPSFNKCSVFVAISNKNTLVNHNILAPNTTIT
jgi:hypothetical protein